MGDADVTDQGTVLIAHGGLTEPLSHSPGDPSLLLLARLIEVDPDSDELVLDLQVSDPDGEERWRIYRAERIPALYPAGYAVEPLS